MLVTPGHEQTLGLTTQWLVACRRVDPLVRIDSEIEKHRPVGRLDVFVAVGDQGGGIAGFGRGEGPPALVSAASKERQQTFAVGMSSLALVHPGEFEHRGGQVEQFHRALDAPVPRASRIGHDQTGVEDLLGERLLVASSRLLESHVAARRLPDLRESHMPLHAGGLPLPDGTVLLVDSGEEV
ncbi:MAG: hypothetical protein ACKO4Z_11390 [Planctomycetota bacterium]